MSDARVMFAALNPFVRAPPSYEELAAQAERDAAALAAAAAAARSHRFALVRAFAAGCATGALVTLLVGLARVVRIVPRRLPLYI